MIDVDFKIRNLENKATIYSGSFKKCDLTVKFIKSAVTDEVKGIKNFSIKYYGLNYGGVIEIMKALRKTSRGSLLLFELYTKKSEASNFTLISKIAVKCNYSSIRISEDKTKEINNFSLSLTLEESDKKII